MRLSTASLASLSSLITKGTTPTTLGYSFVDSGIPFLRVQNISGGQVNFEEDTLFVDATTHSAFKRSQIQAGDVLVTIAGTIGRTGVVPANVPELNCNQAVAIVRTNDGIDRSYLRHWLESSDAKGQMIGSTVTGTISNLSLTQLGELKVPLPSLKEQCRIAAILDQAETLRTQRRAALAQLDDLAQSIFLDMFGDPVTNDRFWPEVCVGHFVAGFESGKSLVADDEDDSNSVFRVLKVSAVTSLEYRPEQSKAVPSGYSPPKTHIVRVSDLLFSRANTTELIGATAFVDSTPDNLLLPDKLWRFMWHEPRRAEPLYVRHLFQQPKFRREIGQRASGTSGSMKNISHEKVLSIRAGHPPLSLQKAFTARIRAIEALKATYRAAMAELVSLFASLQHRAFSGELTRRTPVVAPVVPIRRLFAELGQLEARKGVEALTYAAKRLRGRGHYWPTKVQYLADRHHLEHHGRTIYGETHMAMPHGPVPQAAFSASRALERGELICEFPMDIVRTALRRDGDQLVALREADFSLLSAEERASLDWAIRYVADMGFDQLKTAAHDSAWKRTPANAPIAWSDIIRTLPEAAQQRLFAEFE